MCKHLKIGNVGVYLYIYNVYLIVGVTKCWQGNPWQSNPCRPVRELVLVTLFWFWFRWQESKSRESFLDSRWCPWHEKSYSNLSLLKWSKMVFWVSLQSRCATAIWSLTSRLPKHRRAELGPSSCGDPPALWDPGRARDLGSLCLQHLLKDLEKIHWNMVETCGNWSVSRKYQINNHTTIYNCFVHSPDIGFFVPTSNKPQSRHIPTHQCPHLHHCVARVDLLAENHPQFTIDGCYKSSIYISGKPNFHKHP